VTISAGGLIRRVLTPELRAEDLDAMRGLFAAAWPDGGFSEDDLAHAMGGVHWLIERDGGLVSHASVVERTLEVDGVPLRTGYVEAVATLPAEEGRGHGSAVVAAASDHVRAGFELGVLGTHRASFYERLGWQRWLGPTYVRTSAGLVRTPDEDGGILVLRTPRTPPLDRLAPLSCDWRPGDPW
jgi:aminoglycoside 2'-N-acetyltransferase I